MEQTMNTSISFHDLQSALQREPAPLIIDVRRAPVFTHAAEMISGALRRDPETVSDWHGELPSASTVVVYCVRGDEMSRDTARILNERGFRAYFLEGGIEDGWKAKGGALDAKPVGA